jgi:2-enoate reductase
VDVGCYESWHLSIPPVYAPYACQVDIAREVKKSVGIPVITHGKLGRPEDAGKVLDEAMADFIGLGRSLLADPRWAEKAREGRWDEIVPCIGCSEGCMARGFSGSSAGCAVNPLCAMETEYVVEPADEQRSVMVVGGGAAGMTAAALASSRGHRVVLLERSDALGGQLIPGSAPEFKRDVGRFLDYLRGEVERRGVEVRLATDVTAEDATEERPDVVVIATGGRPVMPDLPGVEGPNVYTAVEVLKGNSAAGDRVVVAGGGVAGCETALFLEGTGREVVLVEEKGLLSSEPVFPLNYLKLVEMLDASGIDILTETRLLEVSPDGVLVKRAGEERRIGCDSVVLALGVEPVSTPGLLDAVKTIGARLFVVGEAGGSGKVLGAVWDGFHAGLAI